MRAQGKGSLRKVGGKYRAQVYLGRDPLDGKRLLASRRFTNEKEAEKWIRDHQAGVKVFNAGECR